MSLKGDGWGLSGDLDEKVVELEGLIVSKMRKVIPLKLMVLLSGSCCKSMSYITLDFEILRFAQNDKGGQMVVKAF